MSESGDRLSAFGPVLETLPLGVVVLTDDGVIRWANDRAAALLGLSRSELDGKRYDDADWDIWNHEGEPIPPADHPVSRVFETGETVQGFTHGITLPDGSERWLSSNAAPVRDDAGAVDAVLVGLEDVTVPKRLERLVETFQPVVAALNRASTRADAERTACELLTEGREYDAAWIASYAPCAAALEVRAQSGLTDPDDDSAALPDWFATGEAPLDTAVETGEIQFVTASGPDSGFDAWEEQTLAGGFRGSAVVPLTHGDRTDGLLGLYTTRADAFDRRERVHLRTVGDRFGQLVHALNTEHALHADTVAELTFRSRDPRSFLVRASGELGCAIDLTATLPAADDSVVHYASVRGAPVDAVVELVTGDGPAGQARPIREQEDPPGGELEVERLRESFTSVLLSSSAVVTKATATDGEAELVCEVPADEDIESLVTRLTDSFPETTLAAKHESDRHGESVGQSTDSLLADAYRDDLTDRQRQVLRAAVYGGYFESPRRSTATEIAAALSLTQSTVSYHLREAQRTLFERMLEQI